MTTNPALPAASIPPTAACPSCEVEIGELHTDQCDVARCAETGLQRSAGCRGARVPEPAGSRLPHPMDRRVPGGGRGP